MNGCITGNSGNSLEFFVGCSFRVTVNYLIFFCYKCTDRRKPCSCVVNISEDKNCGYCRYVSQHERNDKKCLR